VLTEKNSPGIYWTPLVCWLMQTSTLNSEYCSTKATGKRIISKRPVYRTYWIKHETTTTLCSGKNTHSRFLSYLCGKCLDFHNIFSECLGGINKYSLLPVTSCWRHTSVFVNYGLYRWRQTFDEMLNTSIDHCADWTQPLGSFTLWTVSVTYFLD